MAVHHSSTNERADQKDESPAGNVHLPLPEVSLPTISRRLPRSPSAAHNVGLIPLSGAPEAFKRTCTRFCWALQITSPDIYFPTDKGLNIWPPAQLLGDPLSYPSLTSPGHYTLSAVCSWERAGRGNMLRRNSRLSAVPGRWL